MKNINEINSFPVKTTAFDVVSPECCPWLLPNGKAALETLPYAKGVRRFRQRQVVRACKYLIEPPKFDFAWMYQ